MRTEAHSFKEQFSYVKRFLVAPNNDSSEIYIKYYRICRRVIESI